ncbi:MAG: peptidylprolyl isomerase [Candidatus Berkelbacteria bacterium]
MEEKQVSQTTAVIHTSNGDVSIEFYDQDAPKTVENFVGLAKEGYYDNLTFHRVIKSFMIQGGDPSGNGTGGASLWGGKFADEINAESLGLSKDQIAANEKSGYTYRTDITSHKAEVGSIAMANSGPNSNGSQFFIITEQNQPSLDGKYTVFGHVTAGMEAVRAIAAVPVDANDKPTEQVTIDSITVN